MQSVVSFALLEPLFLRMRGVWAYYFHHLINFYTTLNWSLWRVDFLKLASNCDEVFAQMIFKVFKFMTKVWVKSKS